CWFGCSTRAGAQRALPSFPTRRSSDLGGARLPRWDIPARMAVTTGLVLLLTSLAPAVGPRLAGLLATFPLYAAILTVFAHDLEGPADAVEVLRGLLLGPFSFPAVFLFLGCLSVRL